VITAEAAESAVLSVTASLVDKCVLWEVRGLVTQTLSQVKQEKKRKLAEIEKQVLLQRTGKYWKR